ncbi:MAG: hypothetical protein Q9198_006423 [Flavoplaca austrocitrina]
MTHGQLEKCVALGKATADGREDLTELDAISLEMRGQKQKSAPYMTVLSAADRSLGGFGGFWGKEGKFAGEKVRLLREEGVIVDAGKGRVEGNVWRGFI